MRVIIAGSREGFELEDVLVAMEESGFSVTEVVSGTARGVDRLGEIWANANQIPVKRFPANWDEYGKSAGYLRNAEMAKYSDALVALWDGKSKGTEHMINLARKEGLPIHVYQREGDD